jgi:hypothetical protein
MRLLEKSMTVIEIMLNMETAMDGQWIQFIVILQDRPFWVMIFLRRCCQIASGSYFFGFCDKYVFLNTSSRSSKLYMWTHVLMLVNKIVLKLLPAYCDLPHYTFFYVISFLRNINFPTFWTAASIVWFRSNRSNFLTTQYIFETKCYNQVKRKFRNKQICLHFLEYVMY